MPDPVWLIVDVLAAWRVTRLITTDTFPPVKTVRDWLLRRWPSPDAEYPVHEVIEDDDGPRLSTGVPVMPVDGRWLAVTPHWFGDLITCPWCAGMWVSLAVIAVTPGVVWPIPGLLLALATSVLVGWAMDR